MLGLRLCSPWHMTAKGSSYAKSLRKAAECDDVDNARLIIEQVSLADAMAWLAHRRGRQHSPAPRNSGGRRGGAQATAVVRG